MNSSANSSIAANQPGPWIRTSAVLLTIALTSTVIAFVALAGGCRKPPTIPKSNDKGGGEKTDPWEVALRRLQRDTDFATCRTALGTLNSELLTRDDVARPAALTAEAESALSKLVPLNPTDLEEIRPAAFSTHDPLYLADCLYLRDAAQSLTVPGLTPTHQADLAFAWVCRQVYLNPWFYPPPPRPPQIALALPPTLVLRRGSGSALERMYVFLALLQQMGLDGCLVGEPVAKRVGDYHAVRENRLYVGGTPRPFWAVGVRIGNDVRLYDAWQGQPFPTSLNELKANPEAHKAWLEEVQNVLTISVTNLKEATVYLVIPVNSLSPRIAMLEDKLKSLDVHLAINPMKLQAGFPDPKPAFWNPPDDVFAYGRVARAFLPPDHGGANLVPEDRQSGVRLYDQYVMGLLPRGVRINLPELQGDDYVTTSSRILDLAANTYLQSFYEPSNPRERIERGQFQDARRDLVEKQDRFGKSQERLRNSPESEELIREWCKTLKELYNQLGEAGTLPDPLAREARRDEVRKAIDGHWQDRTVPLLLLDRASAEVGLAEVRLLLATCKHEEAEQAQARADGASGSEADRLREEARDAWDAANREWRTYAGSTTVHEKVPGLAAHTRALAERAEKTSQRR